MTDPSKRTKSQLVILFFAGMSAGMAITFTYVYYRAQPTNVLVGMAMVWLMFVGFPIAYYEYKKWRAPEVDLDGA